MATSGLVSAIHRFDFSKPENTRFQYGSSVCLLSIAAPIAGTCDDATPAMILATFRPRLAGRFRFGFRLRGLDRVDGLRGRLGDSIFARLAAVALDRTPALEH